RLVAGRDVHIVLDGWTPLVDVCGVDRSRGQPVRTTEGLCTRTTSDWGCSLAVGPVATVVDEAWPHSAARVHSCGGLGPRRGIERGDAAGCPQRGTDRAACRRDESRAPTASRSEATKAAARARTSV